MSHAHTIANLLEDPSTPGWARDTIHAALTSDPVDAANTLEVIAHAFRDRATRILTYERTGGLVEDDTP